MGYIHTFKKIRKGKITFTKRGKRDLTDGITNIDTRLSLQTSELSWCGDQMRLCLSLVSSLSHFAEFKYLVGIRTSKVTRRNTGRERETSLLLYFPILSVIKSLLHIDHRKRASTEGMGLISPKLEQYPYKLVLLFSRAKRAYHQSRPCL